MMRLATPILLTVCASAQQTQDPAELMRLQRAFQAAIGRTAVSTVRVETFGGTRRVLTDDIAHADGFSKPMKPAEFKYQPADLDDLFERIEPEELERLWLEQGLEPKPGDEPFESDDLEKLGKPKLILLFKKHKVGPFKPAPAPQPAPKDDEKKKEPKLGPLVQPGFLQAQGATTGVVVSADGWILVSRFALNFDPTTILITLPDGRSFNAVRAGEDTSRGIALVKIDATDLQPAEFVDPETVRVGQWALALGRTFDARGTPSVHMGIVSATERLFGRALQIDAYTSPANYGGPVIDLHGRVLGIAVPLSPSGRDAGLDWYDSGIGFATTIGDIPDLVARMKEGERLHRGWLGVDIDGSRLEAGAKVNAVIPDSPAELSGVSPNDVITAVDGARVRNAFHFQMLLSSKMAGDPVHLEFGSGSEDDRGLTVFLAPVPIKERESKTMKEETFTLPWEGDTPPDPDGGR